MDIGFIMEMIKDVLCLQVWGIFMKYGIRSAFMAFSVIGLTFMGVAPANASVAQICISAHVSGKGDQGDVCNTYASEFYAGTVGENRAIEGMWVTFRGFGDFCVEAHVRNKGWVGENCEAEGSWAWIGTKGKNLPMEAMRVKSKQGYVTMGKAHVQGKGWDSRWNISDYFWIGTEGQGRALEAVTVKPGSL
ncbi:hypothetical protein AB0G42_29190 [Streptomyces yangpuensis]|uniref:hypothetical protein n=1 Tax=Streptomyces yangpuensis TaxID=1648182 RepID=UPI003414DC08